MPPVIFAAALAGAASAALGITVLGLGAIASGFVIAGVSLGLSLITQALAPDIEGFSIAARDRSATARATAEPKTLVIGEVALGGQLALFEATGTAKEFLHVVVAHADHPCDAIDNWFVNNDLAGARDGAGNVTAGRFTGHMRLVEHLGALDQAAAPNLVAEVTNWTADHKGGGITYTEARLKWSADVWPNSFNGLRAQLRGMPVYDPRDVGVVITASDLSNPAVFATAAPHGRGVGDQVWIKNHLGAVATIGGQPIRFTGKWHQVASVPSLTTVTLIDLDGQPVNFTTAGTGGTVTLMAWSDNWALAVRMYLTHRASYDAQDDEIDDATVTASANICDEQVALTPEPEVFTADPATDRVTLANARMWKTGDKVDWTSAGTLPAGIPANSFVTRHSATEYGLATTLENARARVAIVITTAGTGVHTATRISQLRYTANGVIRLGQDPHRPLDELMTAAAGTVVTEAGTVRIYAGAATTATGTTDESDMRDADIDVVPFLDRQNVFNAARGKFVDPDQFWTEGDAPPVVNALYTSEDNGELIFRDFQFPFTTDPVMTQRLLKIALERARQGATLKFPAKPSKYGTAVWDVETVTIDHLGYAAKEFRVMGWAEREDFGIDILYREEAAANWDWNLGDETTIDPAPNSNLPDALGIDPPGGLAFAELLYETRDGSGVKARAVLTWMAADNVFVTDGGGYQLAYKLSADPDFIVRSLVTEAVDRIDDIAPGIYDFKVRAISILQAKSVYGPVLTKEVFGLGAAPAIAQDVTISAIGGLAIIRWRLAVDLDVREGGEFKFRHSPLFSGATWAASTSIAGIDGEAIDGKQTSVSLPLKSGTYLMRTFDSSGIQSATVASVTTKQASVLAYTNTDTLAEHPTWLGTHNGTAAPESVLKLDGASLIDDWGLVDSVALWDAEGGIRASGTYDLSGSFDFGSVVLRRLTVDITVQIIEPVDLFDSRTALIDTWDNFDGGDSGSADAVVWARHTDDDPTGSPIWTAYERLDSAEFEARAFQFQARLSSADPAYNIEVSALTVTAAEVV